MAKDISVSVTITIKEVAPPMDASIMVSMLLKRGELGSSVVRGAKSVFGVVVTEIASEKNYDDSNCKTIISLPIRSSWCVVNTVFRTQLCGFSQGSRLQMKWIVMLSLTILMLLNATVLSTSLMLSSPVQNSIQALKEYSAPPCTVGQ